MKKKSLKALKLNKKSITTFKPANVKGGGVPGTWWCDLSLPFETMMELCDTTLDTGGNSL